MGSPQMSPRTKMDQERGLQKAQKNLGVLCLTQSALKPQAPLSSLGGKPRWKRAKFMLWNTDGQFKEIAVRFAHCFITLGK